MNKINLSRKSGLISEEMILAKSKQIDDYLKLSYQNDYEMKDMEHWRWVLVYLYYQYSNEILNGSKQIIGIQGCQGSGKSTISKLISGYFKNFENINAEYISIDDFYMTYKERMDNNIHFRGPPGTHDLSLMEDFFGSVNSNDSNIIGKIFIF